VWRNAVFIRPSALAGGHMHTIRMAMLAVIFPAIVGCQCCQLTEHYQDDIDRIADHQPHLDNYYCPGLDLTRIGYPDWCRYSFNRWIYGDCCCRDTRQPPAYLHNPMYVIGDRSTPMEPVPEEPQVSPRTDAGPAVNGEMAVPTELKGIPDSKSLEKGDKLPPLPPPELPGPLVQPTVP